MATLTGQLVAETYKALLKTINNDVITASEVQISDGFGQGTNVFLDQNGFVRASKYKVTGGNSGQFLKGDGSLDSTSYLPTGSTTSVIPEGTNKYFTELRVLNSILAGFTPISGTVSATDSVLTALEKIWFNILNGGGGGGGGYVPYLGATQNLNLGTYGLISDFVQLNNAPDSLPTTAGTMYWDDANGTVDVILKGGNYIQRIGQDLPVLVKKDDSTGLEKGKVVYSKGSDGSNTTVLYAQANAEATSSKTFGVLVENKSGGSKGYCVTFGYAENIDTSALTEGATVYLSGSVAGGMTTTKPQAPTHLVTIGRCIRQHATQGVIFVTIQNGFEFDELHDVQIVSKQNNQVPVYSSADSLWHNRTIIKTNGYIPYFDSTDLFKDSPLFTDGTKVGIGTTTFIGTNLATIAGGIWAEEATINDQALISTNTLNGDFYISRWSGTAWDVFQTYSASKVLFSKDIEATKFIKTGGLHTQFLMADGLTETITNLSIITGGGSGGTNDGYLTRWNGLQTIQNSLMYETSAGFIGFGTTSPFKKFTVQGGAISVYSSATNYGFMDTSNNSFSFTSANGFYFVANNIGTVASTYVDTTGKWGFGVGTPSYKVDVNGDINTNGLYRVNGTQLSTTYVTEGTNKYLTDASLNLLLASKATAPINWNVVTNAFYMNAANSGGSGYLSQTDWNTFNSKQSALSGTGIVKSTAGTISYLTDNSTNWNTAYDRSIVSASVSGTTTKTLTLTKQDTTTITASWTDYDTAPVTSVFGRTGAILAVSGDYNTSQVTESGNLYYTDARARLALSAGSGISYNNTTGVITSTITQYTDAMARASLSFVAGSGAYNSTTGVITIPTNTNQLTNGASFITLASLSASSPLSYNNTTGAFSISQASGSTNGYLSSADWTTFNNKQNALTNPITGTGTTNYLPKFTGSTTLGDSAISDDGTTILLSSRRLDVRSTYSFFGAQKGYTYILDDQINSYYSTDLDATLNINYYGYNAGSTRFRNFNIYNGKGSSIAYFDAVNSRVGIGTSSPGYKLTVLGGNASTLLLDNDNSQYVQLMFQRNSTANSGFDFLLDGTNSTINMRGLAVMPIVWSTSTSAGSPTEKMRLTPSGNLGLGVTPSAWNTSGTVMQIGTNGTFSLENYSGIALNITQNGYRPSGITTHYYTTTAPASNYYQYNGTHAWQIAPSGTAGTAISFTQAMTLDASGRLMIGTTTNFSNERLGLAISNSSSISSVPAVLRIMNIGINYVPKILITDNNTADATIALAGGAGSKRLSFGVQGISSGFEYLNINENGNVSIGNTNNIYKLDVSGTGRFGNNLYVDAGYGINVGSTSFAVAPSSTRGVINISGSIDQLLTFSTQSYIYNSASLFRLRSDSDIDFVSGGVQRLLISSSTGNVGIGTTSPSAQLHATGAVIIGSAPSSVFKFNVNTTGSKFLSYWIPTLDGVATVGIMAHNGGGYTDQASMGYQATTHMFNLGTSLSTGGTLQVGGDVNITGSFKVNGSPIGGGSGGLSGGGTAGYIPIWSGTSGTPSTALSNSIMSWNGASTISIAGGLYASAATSAFGSSGLANKLLLARPSDGNGTTTYIGFHSASNVDFGIANNSTAGEIRFYANSTFALNIKTDTINLPNVHTSSAGLIGGDVWRDSSGYLRIV